MTDTTPNTLPAHGLRYVLGGPDDGRARRGFGWVAASPCVLVSVMHANNEVGTLQRIAAILTRSRPTFVSASKRREIKGTSMSAKITARTEPLGTSPRITAGVMDQNAVPDHQQALNCTRIAAAVYAAGVNETRDGKYEGIVHIALAASDA
ncbi:hypothetical protein [Streptomyces sp. R33]|uniref:Uncharacterized protein n=1 Tax=Streptomyces sp. R33 TaxID=3238629 RepID=A0AB39XZ63_9ACTN